MAIKVSDADTGSKNSKPESQNRINVNQKSSLLKVNPKKLLDKRLSRSIDDDSPRVLLRKHLSVRILDPVAAIKQKQKNSYLDTKHLQSFHSK